MFDIHDLTHQLSKEVSLNNEIKKELLRHLIDGKLSLTLRK